MEEKELIKACSKARPEAQRLLYERYGPHLMAVCIRYTANREDAEEIFHDSMLRVFNNIRNFQQQSSLKTWIQRIGINASIDFIRKRKNLLIVEHISPEILEIEDVDLDENTILETETALKILKQLPPNQQIIINLFVIDELSHKDIANQLGITEEASRATLSRAKKSLLKLTKNQIKKNEKNELSL